MIGSPPTDFRVSPGLDAEIRQAADALSELTAIATISLRGPGGPVLSRLLDHTAALAARGAA